MEEYKQPYVEKADLIDLTRLDISLTGEQDVLRKQAKSLLDRYAEEDDLYEKVIEFGKQLDASGIKKTKYILWHNLVGSTLGTTGQYYFDTSDQKIERFIKENILER